MLFVLILFLIIFSFLQRTLLLLFWSRLLEETHWKRNSFLSTFTEGWGAHSFRQNAWNTHKEDLGTVFKIYIPYQHQILDRLKHVRPSVHLSIFLPICVMSVVIIFRVTKRKLSSANLTETLEVISRRFIWKWSESVEEHPDCIA